MFFIIVLTSCDITLLAQRNGNVRMDNKICAIIVGGITVTMLVIGYIMTRIYASDGRNES